MEPCCELTDITPPRIMQRAVPPATHQTKLEGILAADPDSSSRMFVPDIGNGDGTPGCRAVQDAFQEQIRVVMSQMAMAICSSSTSSAKSLPDQRQV